MKRADTVVVGAGPGGLAAAALIGRTASPPRVLERGDRVGYCWANLYDSLRLHTGKHLSALPGLRFGRDIPLFPTRDHFVEYLERYARTFRIDPELGRTVASARVVDGGWLLECDDGERINASTVVVATGIISRPFVPHIDGREEFRGRVIHSVEYHRPEPFRGRRVLVVGVGNSGGEIASELARSGVETSIAVRSGANVVPLTLLGVPIQYLATLVRKLPRPAQERISDVVRRAGERRRGPPVLPRPAHSPLDAIPLIGFHLVDEIRAGRVAVRAALTRFTRTGVQFADGGEVEFDDVVLATGFRAAIDFLGDQVRRDARGFALRTDRVRSADHDNLFFIGHNYDSSGGLRNISRDAPLIARQVSRGG